MFSKKDNFACWSALKASIAAREGKRQAISNSIAEGNEQLGTYTMLFIPRPFDEAVKGAYVTRAAWYGRAQRAFSRGLPTGHAFRSAREAFSMVTSGRFKSVHMNQELRTISDGALDSRLRFDVAGIRSDGKIDITEVRSPGQNPQDLISKYRDALGDRAGEIKVVEPTKTVCIGSLIKRDC